MKNIKKEFFFNSLGGDTDCIIKTNIGKFEGDSYFNHEADKGEPSGSRQGEVSVARRQLLLYLKRDTPQL